MNNAAFSNLFGVWANHEAAHIADSFGTLLRSERLIGNCALSYNLKLRVEYAL